MLHQELTLGVDIGGSHITAALVDMDGRTVIDNSWQRSRIQSDGSAEEVIAGWSAVIRECLLTRPNSGRIRIAMPGPFDYECGISRMLGQGKYDALYNVNVKAALLAKLGELVTDIQFANDATCFLQGESVGGAGRGYNHVLGLTLGTGFGSATFKDGRATDADLWRHPFIDGICEDYFSTRWFVRRYFELTGNQVKDVKELISDGRDKNRVTQVFEEFSRNLSLFITEVQKAEEPYDCIVLGGNISNAYSHFLPRLLDFLRQKLIYAPVLVSVLGENAALLGAAFYSEEHNVVKVD